MDRLSGIDRLLYATTSGGMINPFTLMPMMPGPQTGIIHGHALKRSSFVVIERNSQSFLLSGHGPSVSLFSLELLTGCHTPLSELNLFSPLSEQVIHLTSSENGDIIAAASSNRLAIFDFSILNAGGCLTAEHVIIFTDTLVNIDSDRHTKKLVAVFSNGRCDYINCNTNRPNTDVPSRNFRATLTSSEVGNHLRLSVAHRKLNLADSTLTMVTAKGEVLCYEDSELRYRIESIKESAEESIVFSEYFIKELLILCNGGAAYIVQFENGPQVDRKLHSIKSILCAAGTKFGTLFMGTEAGNVVYWNVDTPLRRRIRNEGHFETEWIAEFVSYPAGFGPVTTVGIWDKRVRLMIGGKNGHVGLVSYDFKVACAIDTYNVYEDYECLQTLIVSDFGLAFMEQFNGEKRLIGCFFDGRMLFVMQNDLPLVKFLYGLHFQVMFYCPLSISDVSRVASAYSKNDFYYYYIPNNQRNIPHVRFENMVEMVEFPPNKIIRNVVLCAEAAIVETRTEEGASIERTLIYFNSGIRTTLEAGSSPCVGVDMMSTPQGDVVVWCTATHCYVLKPNRSTAYVTDLRVKAKGHPIVAVLALPDKIYVLTMHAYITLSGAKYNVIGGDDVCKCLRITDARKLYWNLENMYVGAFHKDNYLIIDMSLNLPMLCFPCGTIVDDTYQANFTNRDRDIHSLSYYKDQRLYELRANRTCMTARHIGLHQSRTTQIWPLLWTPQSVMLYAVCDDGSSLMTTFLFEEGKWEHLNMKYVDEGVVVARPTKMTNGNTEALAVSLTGTIAYYIMLYNGATLRIMDYGNMAEVSSISTLDGTVTFVAVEDGSSMLGVNTQFGLIGWTSGVVSTIKVETSRELGIVIPYGITPCSTVVLTSESINVIIMTISTKRKSLIYNVITQSGLLYSYIMNGISTSAVVNISEIPHSKITLVQNDTITASINHNVDLPNGRFKLVVVGCHSGQLKMFLLKRDVKTAIVTPQDIQKLSQEIIHIELYQDPTTKSMFRCVALTKGGDLVSLKLEINEDNLQLSSVLISHGFSSVGGPSSFCRIYPKSELYGVVGDGCEIVKFNE